MVLLALKLLAQKFLLPPILALPAVVTGLLVAAVTEATNEQATPLTQIITIVGSMFAATGILGYMARRWVDATVQRQQDDRAEEREFRRLEREDRLKEHGDWDRRVNELLTQNQAANQARNAYLEGLITGLLTRLDSEREKHHEFIKQVVASQIVAKQVIEQQVVKDRPGG